MAKQPAKKSTQMKWGKGRIFGFGLLAAALLIIANSAYWANNYLFNTGNFTRISTEALTSETSRIAIANRLTEEIFADRPIALQVVGDTSVKLISGLLDGPRLEAALTKATAKLHAYVTSENQESIIINLEGVKNAIGSLIALSDQSGETKVDIERVPDEITVINADDFPSYYKQGVALLWLGPLALIVAGIAIAWPYVKKRSDIISILTMQGAAVLAGGLLALLIGPLFRPVLLAQARTESGRVVIENVYNGFINTFNTQTMWLIVLGLAALAAAGFLWFRQSRSIK